MSGSSTVTTALPWPGTLVSNLSIWSGAVPSFATLPAVVPEPWIFRYKDIRGWWSNPHRNRPGGIPAASPTAWLPQSKPIRFTELGCPANLIGGDYSQMNIWLHKTVLQKIAENGGNIPASLL